MVLVYTGQVTNILLVLEQNSVVMEDPCRSGTHKVNAEAPALVELQTVPDTHLLALLVQVNPMLVAK